MPEISIIIVTYNHEQEISRCLFTLRQALSFHSGQIIVVDNNSSDKTVEQVNRQLHKLKAPNSSIVIENKINLGFTKAVNQGLVKSTGDFILLLNPDTELPPLVFGPLIEELKRNNEIGVMAPQFRNLDSSLQVSCRRFPRHRDVGYNAIGLNFLFPKSKEFNYWKMGDFDHQSRSEVEQPQGAFLLVKREAFEDVGLLDEAFPMFFSDVDWCYRFIQKGWKIIFTPKVKIVHHKGSSIYKNRLAMIGTSHRSFYHYFKKYYPGFGWAVINLMSGVILFLLAIFRYCFYFLKSKF